MKLLIALALFLLTAVPTYAQETPDQAPHHGRDAYVYCEVHGQAAIVENPSSHRLPDEEIAWMKSACVREAMYGGMGEGYWSMPVTDADMKAAKFSVWNPK